MLMIFHLSFHVNSSGILRWKSCDIDEICVESYEKWKNISILDFRFWILDWFVEKYMR